MGFRKILLPFVGSDRHAGVLPRALMVGKDFNAHCEILFIRPEPYQALPYLGDAAPGVVVREIVDSVNQAADASLANLKTAVLKAAAAAGTKLIDGYVPPNAFSVALVERPGDSIGVAAESSRLADLAILVGGEGHSEIVTSGALTGVLMRTGRPVLIIPGTKYSGSIGSNVIIAWDGSTEAANAVRGAMPFLKKAQTIRILRAQRFEENGTRNDAALAALANYLDLHGIKHSEAAIDASAKSIAAALLQEAARAKADLVVMGAYGHSRVREFIVGGVTQHILEHTTVPVLLAH